MKVALVTAADAVFFPLLMDLLATVRLHRPDDRMAIAVMDVGLAAEQVEQVKRLVDHVITPGWDLEFPARAKAPPWFRAMTARPFIPRYLPGYELFVWLDCDLWLADWRAMELLVSGADRDGFAIVPELHRGYRFLFGQENVRQNVHECLSASFGQELAEQIIQLPILNSGVFSMKRDAPHWGLWAEQLRRGVQGPLHHLVEQCALNVACYGFGLPMHFLPAWCNWICGHGIPVYDPDSGWLCEKCLPYEKLSIVHLTDLKNLDVNVPTTTGQKIKMKLNYREFTEWRATIAAT